MKWVEKKGAKSVKGALSLYWSLFSYNWRKLQNNTLVEIKGQWVMKDQGWLKMEETDMDYNNNKLQDAFRPILYQEAPGWSAGGHQNAGGLWDWRKFRNEPLFCLDEERQQQQWCKLTRTFTSLSVSLETTIARTISPSITGSVCPTRDSFTFVTCYKKQKYNNNKNGIWVANEALGTACIQNRGKK